MTSETFIQIATTIAYWTLLWALVSIPASLALFAIARFFPTSPPAATAAIAAHRPGASEATSKFRQALEVAKRRLELGTVRVLLDRKFMRLKRDLNALRKTLDQRLSQITYASKASGGQSLIQLLEGFSSDIDRALDFNGIDDDLVDHSKTLSAARFRAYTLSAFALFIAVVNGGLLYLFFDEMFAGLTVPYLSIELALVAALLFPLLELGSGIGSELAKEKADGLGTKMIVFAAVFFLMIALGTLEYIIFFQLLAGAFEGQAGFTKGGMAHYMVAMVGPALTVAEALFGFGIARNMLVLRELGAVQTIKSHVTMANRFVDGLATRFDQINTSAMHARQSVEEFADQLRGRDEAQLPASTALAEERAKFIQAMDAVNPGKWQRTVDPSQGDVDAVTGYSWVLALGVIVVVAVFSGVFAPEISASIGSGFMASLGLAFASAIVPLIVGGALFDRAASAVSQDLAWKDVFSPRDGAFKLVSVGTLGVLAIGVVWICFDASGIAGIGKAAILLALIAGLCWAASYVDLMVRGLAYLAAVIWYAAIWLLRNACMLLATALVVFVALLAGLLLTILHVLAWPLIWLRSLAKGQRKIEGAGAVAR